MKYDDDDEIPPKVLAFCGVKDEYAAAKREWVRSQLRDCEHSRCDDHEQTEVLVWKRKWLALILARLTVIK